MLKKLRGGYNICPTGRPPASVEVLPEPEHLVIPLTSRRFNFSELQVTDGQRVSLGAVLARDPANHDVPLLAPRAGIVRLDKLPGHLVLENIGIQPKEPPHLDDEALHASKDIGSIIARRRKLLDLGAWQFVSDAHTGALPDPAISPKAVIVSTMRTEPFLTTGSAQLSKRQLNFIRGLEHIQSLLEYQPIQLIIPTTHAHFNDEMLEIIRGYAFVKMVKVPAIYPFDNFTILARALGLKADANEPVWAVNTEGVLAFDRALTLSRPSTVRVISLGGPAVTTPVHLKAMTGYPIDKIIAPHVTSRDVRIINGGTLTGTVLPDKQKGLDTECCGLTVLPEHSKRELFGFLRPGVDRTSYSKCFMSSLMKRADAALTTALSGEHRACVTCGLCEEVCPASLMPWLFHKLAYQGDLEELERARIDLCVECGLCSFVCPSKIDVRNEIRKARVDITAELYEEASS